MFDVPLHEDGEGSVALHRHFLQPPTASLSTSGAWNRANKCGAIGAFPPLPSEVRASVGEVGVRGIYRDFTSAGSIVQHDKIRGTVFPVRYRRQKDLGRTGVEQFAKG